jgi:hypothetical protein
MQRLVLASILLSFLFCQTAHAGETFRIGRPTAAEQGTESVFEAPQQDVSSEPLLGDVIFAGMRTVMPRTAYERWRQNYCAPFVCNMVLCHGSCAEFEEHCPSFMESGRVIHVDAQSCTSSVEQAAASSQNSQKDCCK